MKYAGFTLVELSIVLVIVGLLVGGILSGQSLIRAAELRKTLNQTEQYTTATHSFRDKYLGLPGDLENATAFNLHIGQDGSMNTCRTRAGLPIPLFYNGNGDGVLSSYCNPCTTRTSSSYQAEMANFWMHLGKAGLIADNITGYFEVGNWCPADDNTVAVLRAGVHYPKTPVGKGIIVVTNNTDSALYIILGGFGDIHSVSMNSTTEGTDTRTIASNYLTTQEAYAIDRKIDDGLPLSGNTRVIRRYTNGNPANVLMWDNVNNATNCVYQGVYNTKYTDPRACTLAMRMN